MERLSTGGQVCVMSYLAQHGTLSPYHLPVSLSERGKCMINNTLLVGKKENAMVLPSQLTLSDAYALFQAHMQIHTDMHMCTRTHTYTYTKVEILQSQ